MEKLSIGKMAKLNQTSIQALRLYDRMGILRPAEVNEETGYRYYDVKQSAALDMIHYMQSTGMTLKEIKYVFEKKDLAVLNKALHQHLKDVDRQILELTQQKKAVRRMMDSYDRYLKSPADGTITMEYIGERKIYSRRTSVNFYVHGIEAYESILKDLKKEMVGQGVSQYYYYNAGTTIAREDFIAGTCVSDKIFVFVDQECGSGHLQTLSADMYACIYCDDFDKEQDYIVKLRAFTEEQELQVIGDYICEVLTELPFPDSGKREMFLRLQVPVRFKEKLENKAI